MTSLEKILSEMWYDPTEMANEEARIKHGKEILELIQNKYPNIAARIIKNKEIQNSSIEQDLFIEALRAVKDPKAEECLEQLEERISEVPAGTSKAMNNLSTIRIIAMIGSVVNASSVENCSWLLSLSAMLIYSGAKRLPFMSIKTSKDVIKYFNRQNSETLYSSATDPEIHDFVTVLSGKHILEPSFLFYKKSENHYVFNHRNIKNYTIPVEDGSISKTSLDEKGNEIKTADVLSQMPEQLNDVFLESLKQRNIELPGEVMAENTSKKLASFSLEKLLFETWFNDDEVADEAKRTDYTKLILKLISGKYPNIAAKVLEEKDKQTNPESFIMTYGAFKKPELAECLDQLEDMVAEIPQQFSIMTIIDTLRTTREKLNPSIDNCSWILSLTAFFVYRGKTDWQIPHMDSIQDARQSLDGHNPDLIYDSASDPELYTFSQILKNEHFVHPEKLSYYQGQDIHYNFNITGVNSYNIPIIGNAVSETSTDDGGNDVTTLNVISKMKEQMYDVFIADLKEKNIQIPQEVLSEKFENESISVGGGAFSGGPMGMVGRSKKKHKHGF